MYHKPSKRRQLIRRVAIYTVMTLSVLTIVSALVLYIQGYEFNRKDGRIEQGGLVRFETIPGGGKVTVDGVALTTETPSKSTLTAGRHYVTIARDGFRLWQKPIDVVPGSVLLLNYIRLIPNEPSTASVKEFSGMDQALPTIDRHTLAVVQNGMNPEVTLVDLTSDSAETKKIQIPTDDFTSPKVLKNQLFKMKQWDTSGRYILIQHTFDASGSEWLVVDTKGNNSVKNISKTLDIGIEKAVFGAKDDNLLYVLVGSSVRRINLSQDTLSGPIINDVRDFSVNDHILTYVRKVSSSTHKYSVGYSDLDDSVGAAHTLRTFADADLTGDAHWTTYFGDSYYMITHDKTVDIYKADLPVNESDAKKIEKYGTLKLPSTVTNSYFSKLGRFVVAETKGAITVFDLELRQGTTTPLKANAKNEYTGAFGWLEDYTAYSDYDGALRLYEYDGTNQQVLLPVTPGIGAYLSPNGRYIYSAIQKVDKSGFTLQRTTILP